MNDRFKFRVWDTEIKEYLVGCFLVGGSNMIHNSVDYESFLNKGNFVIEQCTGVKDKNGNLIYEGDCVGFYVYGQDEEWHAQQGTVIWYNSCWGIETSSRFIQFENELTIKNPKDIEIIGNIHEQAEQKDK